MKNYVLGFLFSEYPTRVVLIRKSKPEWQRGLLNGVGGKVEDGETPHDAMVREFEEEAGVNVPQWTPYCAMIGNGFRVDVFKATDSLALQSVRSATDEAIMTLFPHAVLDPHPQDCHRPVSNLPWLIAMAMDDNDGNPFIATVDYAEIKDYCAKATEQPFSTGATSNLLVNALRDLPLLVAEVERLRAEHADWGQHCSDQHALSAAQKRIEIQAQEIERLNLTIRHYDHLSSASQDYKDYKLCPICRTDPCCGEAGCP